SVAASGLALRLGPPRCASTGRASRDTCTPSRHDALPISLLVEQGAEHILGAVLAPAVQVDVQAAPRAERHLAQRREGAAVGAVRSEEHTSELQSRDNLVCRPLLHDTNASSVYPAMSGTVS